MAKAVKWTNQVGAFVKDYMITPALAFRVFLPRPGASKLCIE